jgi:hypothetical protein
MLILSSYISMACIFSDFTVALKGCMFKSGYMEGLSVEMTGGDRKCQILLVDFQWTCH